MTAKQNMFTFSCYRSKRYASEVLGDSKVTFLRDGEDAGFFPTSL